MGRTVDEDVRPGIDERGGPPSLVVVCGYPGVGKSRVARSLSDLLGAPVVRTDEVRKDLRDDPTYSATETERVYAELLDRALSVLEADGRAILDGTFRKASFRDDVAAAADRLGVECAFVKVECPEPVVRERIADRGGVSDAGIEEYHLVRGEFDRVTRTHLTVDNSGDWARTRDQLLGAFRDGEG